MSETIYRVLHIFESDYGCEEHSEPMVDVVLESPDGRRSTIPYSDARLYALDIFEGAQYITTILFLLCIMLL